MNNDNVALFLEDRIRCLHLEKCPTAAAYSLQTCTKSASQSSQVLTTHSQLPSHVAFVKQPSAKYSVPLGCEATNPCRCKCRRKVVHTNPPCPPVSKLFTCQPSFYRQQSRNDRPTYQTKALARRVVEARRETATAIFGAFRERCDRGGLAEGAESAADGSWRRGDFECFTTAIDCRAEYCWAYVWVEEVDREAEGTKKEREVDCEKHLASAFWWFLFCQGGRGERSCGRSISLSHKARELMAP